MQPISDLVQESPRFVPGFSMLESDLHDKGDNLKLASDASTAFDIINKCKDRKQKLKKRKSNQ